VAYDASILDLLATAAEVGSIWGIAYNKTEDIVYTSAFMKAAAEFPSQTNGSNDPGRIYSITNASTTSPGNPSILTTLNAGTDPQPTGGTNGGSPWVEYYNSAIINAVGKIGFGDIDISADDQYLYAWNMSDKTLYEINTSNGSTNNTFSAPNIMGCAASDVIPGAVKYDSRNDNLLVGYTCSCESSPATTPSIYVYELDPLTGIQTEVLNASLGYDRQKIGSTSETGGLGGASNWNSWADVTLPNGATSTDDTSPPFYDEGSVLAYYPQPWLLDIELDEEGYMILAVDDRFGNQTGPGYPVGFGGYAAGDVLIAAPSGGSYVLENNGSVGNRTKGSTNTDITDRGMGGDEFFYHDRFAVNAAGANEKIAHSEITSGGVAVMKGATEVLLGIYDPAPVQDGANFGSGGVISLSTQDGSRTRSVELYGPGDMVRC